MGRSQQNKLPELRQLLHMKQEPLLRELLREAEICDEAYHQKDHRKENVSKPSIRERFRNLTLKKPFFRDTEETADKAKRVALKVVVQPSKDDDSSVKIGSPIKSPCRNKRGFLVEAAVKVLDQPTGRSRVSPSSPPSKTVLQLSQQKKTINEKNAPQPRISEKQRRSLLSRSSSESSIRNVTKKEGKVASKGLAKLSEFGKKIGRSNKSESSKRTKLGRSHSDLGLQSRSELRSESASSKSQLPNFFFNKNKQNTAPSSILSYSRLFRRDTKNSNGETENAKKSEPSSSLVRNLLLRRKSSTAEKSSVSADDDINTAEFTKQEAIIKEVPHLHHSDEIEHWEGSEFDGHTRTTTSSGSSPQPASNCEAEAREENGQPSPVSVLEAPFELHTLDSSSEGSNSPGVENDKIISAIRDISRIRCIDLSSIIWSTGEEDDDVSAYVDDVVSTSNAMYGKWWDERVYGEVENRKKGGMKLEFDCIDEALNAKVRKSLKGGWRYKKVSEVVEEVNGEICGWRSMWGCSTDELVENDMKNGVGKWMDQSIEVDEVVRDVEGFILRRMIDQIVLELQVC